MGKQKRIVDRRVITYNVNTNFISVMLGISTAINLGMLFLLLKIAGIL